MILEYLIEAPSFVEWSPIYLEVAEKIIRCIKRGLRDIEVHHVGSTSVPYCGGKGSIDLAITYPDGQLECARDIIDGFGFQRQKTRTPFPESRPMRTGAIEHLGKIYKIHVHVLAKNSEELAGMLHFRDRLRTDAHRRKRYVRLKKQILEQGVVDSIEYSELKGVFFNNNKQV